MAWPWLVLALVLPAPPVSEAPDPGLDSIELRVGPDDAWLETLTTLSVAESIRLRQVIDSQHGDGDGIVQDAEVRAYEAARRIRNGANAPDCFGGFRLVRIDGRPPVALRERTVSLANASGAATNAQPILERRHQLYAFAIDATAAAASVDLRGIDDPQVREPCSIGGQAELGGATGDPPPPQTRILIGPLRDALFDLVRVEPSAIRGDWTGDAFRPTTPQSVRLYWSGPLRLPFGEAPTVRPSHSAATGPDDAGPGLTAWTVLLAFLLLARPAWRLLSFLAFSRLDRDKAFDHETRASVYRCILAAPGLNMSELARVSQTPRATLRWHVRVLQVQRHVRVVRRGRALRIFAANARLPPDPVPAPQLDLERYVRDHPGQSERTIAKALGLPRTTVAYRLQALRRARGSMGRMDG